MFAASYSGPAIVQRHTGLRDRIANQKLNEKFMHLCFTTWIVSV